MRSLIMALMMCPFILTAQDGHLIFQNATIVVDPGKRAEFESAMAHHNKTYHKDGQYGARVYQVRTGANVGKYMWIMGPTTWGAMDTRPDDPAHDLDWENNVISKTQDVELLNIYRFRPELSFFPTDFTLDKLLVWQVDVAKDGYEQVTGVIEKVRKVHQEELPGDIFGVYTNELSSSSRGDDIAIIWFFDKWGWMGDDSDFGEKFEAVHGEGSWAAALEDWSKGVNGIEREIWVLREDLSGASSMIKAADRQ